MSFYMWVISADYEHTDKNAPYPFFKTRMLTMEKMATATAIMNEFQCDSVSYYQDILTKKAYFVGGISKKKYDSRFNSSGTRFFNRLLGEPKVKAVLWDNVIIGEFDPITDRMLDMADINSDEDFIRMADAYMKSGPESSISLIRYMTKHIGKTIAVDK